MSFEAQEPFDESGRSPAHQAYEEGRRLMRNGELEQAIDLFRRSAVLAPHFKTYELMGECFMQLKRFSEAIPYLAAATFLNRGVRAPSLLAEAWLEIGRHPEAVGAADIALSRDPTNKSALRTKGIAAPKVEGTG